MRFASRALLLHTIKKRAFTFAVSLFLFLSFSLSLWIYDPNFLCPAAPPLHLALESIGRSIHAAHGRLVSF